jgi:hypothetical protein
VPTLVPGEAAVERLLEARRRDGSENLLPRYRVSGG